MAEELASRQDARPDPGLHPPPAASRSCTRGHIRALFEKRARATWASVALSSSHEEGRALITSLSHTTIWVLDQDEALAFYTEELGFEASRRRSATTPATGSA
jgi:hypothetical protein